MRKPSAGRRSGPSRRRALLSLRVHYDGFRASPRDYLQALWWRARGLRLRSRHTLSGLIGRSPRAYDLWRLEQEDAAVRSRSGTTDIFAVMDCRESALELSHSLHSIEVAGLRPIIIGEVPRGYQGAAVSNPQGLSQFVPASGTMLLVPLRSGDCIAPGTGHRYLRAIQGGERLLYADDDLIDAAGRRSEPHFKPGWNSELFRHHDYLTGACLIGATKEELSILPDKGWEKALVRLLLHAGVRPRHVPAVLHHRRQRPLPKVPTALPPAPDGSFPLVTVIIPTRNQAGLLRACMAGLKRTDYPRVQTIVVDNGSDEVEALSFLDKLHATGVHVMRCPGAFNFSALNNAAAKLAKGKLLCLLNNDIEVFEPNWLQIMAAQALREDVGAVGARLLYPDRTIQHAGVVIGLGGGAGHAHRFQHIDGVGYFERAHLPQFVSGVTAACLVVDRERYWAVGGLDEEAFPVAFNDVDFCLRLNARGWQSFYEPRATLVHHESKSRGKDTDAANRDRFAKELAALKSRWSTDEFQDPFHHPALSRFSERFVVDL